MQKCVYLIKIRPLFLFGSASFFRSSVGMCCFTSILAPLKKKKKKKKNYYMVSEDGELLSPHGAACEAAAFAQRPACALRAVSPFLFKKENSLFPIAVCFLHPVIVGNEVGNTNRSPSSSFYVI